MEALDNEISDIRSQIARLQAHRQNLSSILLSSPNLPSRLSQRPVTQPALANKAQQYTKDQQDRLIENTYRLCAGITAFKVQDPDPNAIDDGRVLGVRIDVSVEGTFVEEYVVLLVRPDPEKTDLLKIHKHTVPTCIPLQALADKYLPLKAHDGGQPPQQRLVDFGAALRKELVSWHLRLNAVRKQREEAGLQPQPPSWNSSKDVRKPAFERTINAFSDSDSDTDELMADDDAPADSITALDANAIATEITVKWANGTTGKFTVAKSGDVTRAVVRSVKGSRVSQAEKKAEGRIEELVQRLQK